MRRALLLSTVLLLAGCGGGDDEKAAYLEDAAAVCESAVEQFEALTVPTTPEGFAPYADSLVGILEDAHHELAGLTPPEDDRAELEQKALDPLEELVADGKEYATEVREAGTDQTKLLTLLSERPTTEGIDTEFLREYGLPTCAEAVEQAG
jgi:hypothetical protein